MKYPLLDLTRRGFLLGGATALTASRLRAADPSCTLIPEQEEGPYYIDFNNVRRDLTEGRPGVPLQLRVALVDSRTCMPIENAAVDIWHCDALGVYSGFTANGGGDAKGKGPGGRGKGKGKGRGATDETRFLRGIQLTGKQGAAEFATLYPGWYQGRTIHIHLKVHTGGHVSHTGQIFLPEDITADIAKLEPYVNHSNVHRTLHGEDNIFLRQGGSKALATLERLQKGSNAGGFVATVTLAVDPTATPAVF